MRTKNNLAIQAVIEYTIEKTKTPTKYFHSKTKTFRTSILIASDFMALMSWLTDAENHPTTQTAVGERLGWEQQKIQKSFARLLQCRVLDKTLKCGGYIKIEGHSIPQFKIHSELERYIQNYPKLLKERSNVDVGTPPRSVEGSEHPPGVSNNTPQAFSTVREQVSEGGEFYVDYWMNVGD